MKNVLFVDCCIRREASNTRKLAKAFLSALPSDCAVTRLDLMAEDLSYFKDSYFDQREALLAENRRDHPRFRYAHQFAQADLIVIAAPFWDLSFPALLKVYIEQVSVDGITFGSTEEGLKGLCRASHLVFLTTRGGFYTGDTMEMGSRYLDALNFQETSYPANYNKLRFLENHDQPRIASFVRDERALVNDTAMLYFLKGTTLLYAGQEFENDHLPSLFDLDPIDRRTGHDLSGLLRRLYAVKHQLGSADWFFADADDANDLALLQRGSAGKRFVGVFSLKAKAADVRVDAADGVYENLIDRSAVTVKNGILSCTGEPVILRAES